MIILFTHICSIRTLMERKTATTKKNQTIIEKTILDLTRHAVSKKNKCLIFTTFETYQRNHTKQDDRKIIDTHILSVAA
jgi:hypothetical protein